MLAMLERFQLKRGNPVSMKYMCVRLGGCACVCGDKCVCGGGGMFVYYVCVFCMCEQVFVYVYMLQIRKHRKII